MASGPELPLSLFSEHSSAFCSLLENDLDQFINEIGDSFSSVNRTVKIAPKQRRKKRQLDNPGSCTLDLKEFTTSKQNVLQKLQTRFENMEQKWSNDVAELKDWFLNNIETCLSKVQLEIRVSAEDLNLTQPVQEIQLREGSPDSGSEIDAMSVDQLSNPPQTSSHNTNGHPQDFEPSHVSGPSSDVARISFQEDMSSLQAESVPPVTSKRSGKRVAATAPVKKGKNATRLNKKEIASDSTIPDSGVDEPPLRSRRSNWQGTAVSYALGPPDSISTNDLQESAVSLHTVSPPPVENTNKRSKKVTGGRAQMKRGVKSTQLSREDIADDSSIPKSHVAEPAVRSSVSETDMSSASTGVINTNDFQEVADSFPTASPPPTNTNKRGRKGTGRAQVKKGAKSTQLRKEDITTDSSIPDSDIEEPAVRSGISDTDITSAIIPLDQEDADPFHTVSPPPPLNMNKRGRKGTGRAVKKGAMAAKLNREQVATNSINPSFDMEELAARSGVIGTNHIEKTASPPPKSTTRRGKSVTSGRGQIKKGAEYNQMSVEDPVPNSYVDEPAVRGKVYPTDVSYASVLPNISTTTRYGEIASHTVNPPPASTKKMGRKVTGRAQVKNRNDDDIVTISDSGVNWPALGSKVSGFPGSEASHLLGSYSDVNRNVLQENIGSSHSANPPLPANTKKIGRKGTGRAQMKKGSKATESSNDEIAGAVNIPISNTVEPALRSKMSDWQGLLTAVENAPCRPGLYEVKVWRAKKPAYIGHTDDLQQSVSQYREGKSSGEKHLDQFIQRNKDEISVRYEIYPSLQLAKLEQKKRLKEFMEKHKNLPSYNYGL